MTFLPIVGRELRVAARRHGVHWARMGAALTAIVIGGWIMLIPEFRSPHKLGILMFVWLAILAFAYSLFSGVFTTADSLSREKREGTLGLLFLTDLKGFDIVLGKLVATSIHTFYGLLAIFPVLAIPLLAGGVTINEFYRVLLALLNMLFFSLTTGLFCSSICRDDRKAATLTALIVIVFAGGLPMAGALWAEMTNTSRPEPIFFILSPGYTFFIAFEECYTNFRTFNFYQTSLGAVHGLSWLWLIITFLLVPRTWQDKASRQNIAGPASFGQRFKFGALAARKALRARLLEINPVLWLCGRYRMNRYGVWLFLALVAVGWVIGWLAYPRDWTDEPMRIVTALVLHTALKIWMASAACYRFNDDRQSGALELLLATPLAVGEIVRGQLRALRRQFLGPAVVVLAVDFIFLMTRPSDDDWIMIWSLLMIIFAADMIALAWVGMWLGLKSKSATKAQGAAIARIMILPWVLFYACLTGYLVLGFGRRSPDEEIFYAFALVVALGVDVVFTARAMHGLKTEFRTVAAQRFEARRRRWPWSFLKSPEVAPREMATAP